VRTGDGFVKVVAALMGLYCSGSWAGVEIKGSLTQGGLLECRVTPANARVELDGQALRVSPKGLFLVGFDRDHPLQSQLTVRYADGSTETVPLQLTPREYDIQRIDGLPPKTVEPSAEDLKRIRRETALVNQARRRDDSRTDFLSGWSWPVEGPLSGVFGSQRILNGEPRRPHMGVDIAVPAGTPVRAPADGVVTLAYPDMFFSGGTLFVDHGYRLSSSFLHLSKILVKEGQRVHRGEVIAEVGSTGRATGPHLHWGVNLGTVRLDPQLLVPPMPSPPLQNDAETERK
jgi:murein DD-endopeptidase MepM/ murein hydrolase activator NlpD